MAQALIQAANAGKISYDYDEVEEIAKDDSADVLLPGFECKLLLPTRSARGTLEWVDALLVSKPGEVHKTRNVVKSMVEEASQIGR